MKAWQEKKDTIEKIILNTCCMMIISYLFSSFSLNYGYVDGILLSKVSTKGEVEVNDHC